MLYLCMEGWEGVGGGGWEVGGDGVWEVGGDGVLVWVCTKLVCLNERLAD